MSALHALFCLLTPAVALWLTRRFTWLEKVGPVVLTYGAGIALANLPGVHLDPGLGTDLAGAGVLLAIPLLLFSTEVRKWLSLARGLLVAFGSACVASVVAASAVALVFRAQVDEWWKIAGMLVGVYVGGSANMSAVGFALGTRTETFAVLNTADLLCGGAYFFFLISLAPRLLGRFLKPFAPRGTPQAQAPDPLAQRPWNAARLRQLAGALGLAVAIVAVSVGLSFLATRRLDVGVVMLAATTLGIAASLVERVRALDTAFPAGDYALLVFCAAMGSLADASQFSGASALLLGFVVLVVLFASSLHFALCWLFGVDLDSAIISSTAAIFGPPFIGPVAAALKNRELVGPGLTLGLAGLALGTYLGLATAWALKAAAG